MKVEHFKEVKINVTNPKVYVDWNGINGQFFVFFKFFNHQFVWRFGKAADCSGCENCTCGDLDEEV